MELKKDKNRERERERTDRKAVARRWKILPAVQAELAAPAETMAFGGSTLCLVKTSTRRGAHSSFCSLCPSLSSAIMKLRPQ